MLEYVTDFALRITIDHLRSAIHLDELVGLVDAMQFDVTHDRVRAMHDHFTVDHRLHVHDQAIFLDQPRVAAHDARMIDDALVIDHLRRRTHFPPTAVFRVRAHTIARSVEVTARNRWDRSDARQPEDEQGTVDRLVQMFHCSTPR
ncbi:MAG: hypothetical protein ACXWAX_11505 [Chthoniobacterales bacterium]